MKELNIGRSQKGNMRTIVEVIPGVLVWVKQRTHVVQTLTRDSVIVCKLLEESV